MGIVPDLRQDVWHFSGAETDETSGSTVQGESTLSPEQQNVLKGLINRKLCNVTE